MTDEVSKKDLVDMGGVELSVKRRCELLGLPRSSYYALKTARPEFAEEEERAMVIMDRTHADMPSYGARRHNIHFGRHHVARLMAHMGIRSTAPQPRTSENKREHPRFPCLLRGLATRRPNQVWSTDITYSPLGRGHVYLSVVIDWYSRFIIGWRLHDTLEARECVARMRLSCQERSGLSSISKISV